MYTQIPHELTLNSNIATLRMDSCVTRVHLNNTKFPQEWRVVPHESIANREQWNFENGAFVSHQCTSNRHSTNSQNHLLFAYFLVIIGVICMGMYFKSEKGTGNSHNIP